MSKVSQGTGSPVCGCDGPFARLLSWENPTTSGSLFLGFNLVYFFVFVLRRSLLSVSCYFLLVPFAVGFLFRVLDVAPACGDGPVEVVSRGTISTLVNRFYEKVNNLLETVRDVLLWKNAMFSAKCCVVTWAIGYLSSFFSMYFLLFCFVWFAFGLSFIKKVCAASVSPYVTPYVKKSKEFVHRVREAIPRMDDVTK